MQPSGGSRDGWYYQEHGKTQGPVPLDALQALVASGRLKPSDEVWRQGTPDWVRVDRVAELRSGTELPAATAGAAERRPAVDAGAGERPLSDRPEEARRPRPVSSADAWPWPVVRARRLGWGRTREVVRIGPDGLLLLQTDGPVTEDVLAESGRDGVTLRTHLPRESIRAVRVRRVGYVTESSLWRRFRVESERGTHEFRVPERECPNVVRALRALLGDRFDERPVRRPAAGEVALAVAGVGAALSLLLGLVSWFLMALGLLALLVVLVCFLAVRGARDRSPYRVPSPARRPRRRGSGRPPFRSPVLGWALKVLGLAYIVFIFQSEAVGHVLDQVAATTPSVYSFFWVLYVPGILAMVLGYRLCLRTFHPREHPDPRAPVLFLRAFDDDGRQTFQPTGWLARLHGIDTYWQDTSGPIWTWRWRVPFWYVHPTKLLKMFFNADNYSAEELLAGAFRQCGPFVAIGRPGELLPTPGADRMYVPDADWQAVVLEWLERCQAVVLQPAESEGVRWEMEQVFARVRRRNVLLSLLNFRDRPNAYEDFRAWLAGTWGLHLPLAVPFREAPCCAYFEPDGTPRLQPVCYRSPLVWSFVGSAVDTARTFHTFIKGRGDGPRELPLQPRRHRGHAALSVVMVAGLAAVLLFGPALSGLLGYQATVAEDIARDWFGAAPAQRTTCRGRAVPYELTLDGDWKPAAVPPDVTYGEHVLEYRGGLGKLLVKAAAEDPPDADAFPQVVRDLGEQELRQRIPAATVRLAGSRRVTLNGVEWLEVTLEQHYGPGANEERRVFLYTGESEWVLVSVVLPSYGHYGKVFDDVAGGLRVPETDRDRLLREAREGTPVTYRGKAVDYRWSLPPVWKPADVARQVAEMNLPGVKPDAASLEGVEHYVELNNGRFAAIGVETKEGELDLGKLEEIARETAAEQQGILGDAFPGFRLDIAVVRQRLVQAGPREWGEFELRVSVSGGAGGKSFAMIYRVIRERGRVVIVTARIQRDEPVIRRLTTEALDALRFDD